MSGCAGGGSHSTSLSRCSLSIRTASVPSTSGEPPFASGQIARGAAHHCQKRAILTFVTLAAFWQDPCCSPEAVQGRGDHGVPCVPIGSEPPSPGGPLRGSEMGVRKTVAGPVLEAEW